MHKKGYPISDSNGNTWFSGCFVYYLKPEDIIKSGDFIKERYPDKEESLLKFVSDDRIVESWEIVDKAVPGMIGQKLKDLSEDVSDLLDFDNIANIPYEVVRVIYPDR